MRHLGKSRDASGDRMYEYVMQDGDHVPFQIFLRSSLSFSSHGVRDAFCAARRHKKSSHGTDTFVFCYRVSYVSCIRFLPKVDSFLLGILWKREGRSLYGVANKPIFSLFRYRRLYFINTNKHFLLDSISFQYFHQCSIIVKRS